MSTQTKPSAVWVKNFKSLRNVKLDFSTKLTIVAGPSGSGKTALAEAFLLLSDAAWGRILHYDEIRGASVTIKTTDRCAYKVRVVGAVQKDLKIHCPQEGDADALEFLRRIAVILNIDWKAVRRPQPPSPQERLLPDASNFVPYLYTVTNGVVPESFVVAAGYVIPNVKDMWFDVKDGRLFLKLAAANGAVLDQTNMPAGVLKTLIVEAALHADPTLLVIDEFENSLHPETQQFLMDEFRSHDVYAVLMTHSTVPLDYAKSVNEVVLLSLENGETKARRLGKEVEEELRRSKLTLSELIWSGLLTPI